MQRNLIKHLIPFSIIILSLISTNSNIITNQLNDSLNNETFDIDPLKYSISSDELNISLISPQNMSTITNGTDILLELKGSLDKNVTYRWSNEITNSSFLVIESYFAIMSPDLPDDESLIELYVYASVNSTETNSSWITRQYMFYYDTLIPSFVSSIANFTSVFSFTKIQINTSEPIFNSRYSWDYSHQINSIPNNATSFVINVNLGEGNHVLELTLNDFIGNSNKSILNITVLFTIISTPENNTKVQSGSLISFTFNEPYNALFAWDLEGFSGVIDPVPETEGSHIIHIKVEKSPNEYIIQNFTFIADNTPIVATFNPSGGLYNAGHNITITVDETPSSIVCSFSGDYTGSLSINGTDPYWFSLPVLYGKINITVEVIDEARNVGTQTKEFEVGINVQTMFPENNTIINQDTSIFYNINAGSWRTILFNMNNTFNTTYLPTLPRLSGRQNLTIYLEDDQKRWSSFYYQWWIKPRINLENSFNGSRMRSDNNLNFTFGEIIKMGLYQWGNDTPLLEIDVKEIITNIDDWSNKTNDNITLRLKIKGKDDIWNNQTFKFTRDDISLNIALKDFTNSSILHTPFRISYNFSEKPEELRYSIDGNANSTYFIINDPFFITLPKNISTNPHEIVLFFRDEAYNWNSSRYIFYIGTSIREITLISGSVVMGGDKITFDLLTNSIRVGFQWVNETTSSNITSFQWIQPSINYTIQVPYSNNWTQLILFYDIGDNIIINETLKYKVDSIDPTLNILGTEGPFSNQLLIENDTKHIISPETIINLTVSENVSFLSVIWSNTTIIYNNSFYMDDFLEINLITLIRNNRTTNFTAFLVDIAGNNASFVWYLDFDEIPPFLISYNPTDNSRMKPNTSITFNFNETLYFVSVHTYKEGVSLRNDSFYFNITSFQLFSEINDANYNLDIEVYDLSGNVMDFSYHYTVDGTSPTVSVSYENNTHHNSKDMLEITVSETITNRSYYHWDNGNNISFNTTMINIDFSLIEGIHTLQIYVEDLLGNNKSVEYVYIIDDTPVNSPESSISSGSIYTSDNDIVTYYFEERPNLVIASWNNGTNITLSIYTETSLMFGIYENNGIYYVRIKLPTTDFQTHSLRLFVRDDAGNWIKYEYKYYKIPSLRDFMPIILLLVFILFVIMYIKRKSLKTHIEHIYDKIGNKFGIEKKSPVKEKNSSEEKGDKVIYRKGDKKLDEKRISKGKRRNRKKKKRQ